MKIERTLPALKLYTFQELKPGDVFYRENSPEHIYLKIFDTDSNYINAVDLTTNLTAKFNSETKKFVLPPDAKLVV